MTIDTEPLGSPYRVIRAVRPREDGPWPGLLVRAPDATRILVASAELGPNWSGWEAPADGHILAPLDVVRRRGGHDAVLPVCAERLEDFLRRRAARLPLTSGEVVTLGVSLLRACAQLTPAPDTTGEWWLDDAGRPVLATETSPRRALEHTAELLAEVPVDAVMQRTWQTAQRAVASDRVSAAELVAVEDALFALAAAEPLSTVSLGSGTPAPRRAVDQRVTGDPGGEPEQFVHEPAPRSMWHTLVAGVDDDLADTVSKATTAVWRRLRAPADRPARTSSRRAPWLVGGGVAAAVLAGGVLWPSAGGIATDASPPTGGGASAAPPTTSGPPAGQPAPQAADASPSEPAPPADTAPGDLPAVTTALLDARLACGGDSACLAGVLVDPSADLVAGAVDLAASGRTVSLLDDFGDLAVLRVDSVDAKLASQLVVILRREEKWLLRDVHDVAQQP